MENGTPIIKNMHNERVTVEWISRRWILDPVYLQIVTKLGGLPIVERNPIYSRYIQWTPDNLTVFPFEIRYDIMKSDGTLARQKKLLVGKIIPDPITQDGRQIIDTIFKKDGHICNEILVFIHEHLRSNQPVAYPRIYYEKLRDYSIENKNRLVVFEDMYGINYQLHDYENPLTFKASSVVMKAFARLHAGYHAVKEKPPVMEAISILREQDIVDYADQRTFLQNCLSELIESNAVVLELIPGYVDIAAWLREMKPRAVDHFINLFNPSNKFKTLCHGTFGVNLLYFGDNQKRVSLGGHGGARVSSNATDINNFLFTCIDSSTRREEQNNLIEVYYKEFTDIMEYNNIPVPFTLDELLIEVKKKYLTGWFASMYAFQTYYSHRSYCPDLILFNSNKLDEYVDQSRANLKTLMGKSIFKNRLLRVYDDLKHYNALVVPLLPDQPATWIEWL